MRKSILIAAALAASALTLGACHGARSQDGPERSAGSQGGQSAAFMAKIAKEPGVVVLPSGLAYKVVKTGPASGQAPKTGDEVKVNYEGTLTDGTVFDSSYKSGEPVVFPVGGLIPGWNEALTLMKPGDTWILYVPPALGYGPDGKGPIPPDSVLVFKLELLDVLSHSGPSLG